MDIAEDLRRTALQEERLQFGAFDAETAWALGTELKRAGEAREAKIVVDIRLTTMELLSFALPGAAPDNFDWVRRKRNVVFHFRRGITPKDTDRLRRFRERLRYDRELYAKQQRGTAL